MSTEEEEQKYQRKVNRILAVIALIILVLFFWKDISSLFNSNSSDDNNAEEVIKEEVVKEEEKGNNILDCTSLVDGATMETIYTYADNKKDILEVKTIATVRDIPDEELGLYSLAVATFVDNNIDGYDAEVSLENNTYTFKSTMDLIKIPSGTVEDNDATILVELLPLADLKAQGEADGAVCIIK